MPDPKPAKGDLFNVLLQVADLPEEPMETGMFPDLPLQPKPDSEPTQVMM